MKYVSLDRLNRWWQPYKQQHIPKAYVRLRATLPGVYLPGGWTLITWSAFGWNLRAWAASIGALFLFNVVTTFLAEFFASKRKALRRPND